MPITDVYASLLSILIISTICGVYPLITYKKNGKSALYYGEKLYIITFSHIVFFTVVIISLVTERLNNSDEAYEQKMTQLSFITFALTGITTISLHFICWYKTPILVTFIQELPTIDTDLKRCGCNIDHRNTFVLLTSIFAFRMLLYAAVIVAHVVIAVQNGDHLAWHTWISFMYPVAVVLCCDSLFTSCVYCLSLRFQVVNTRIAALFCAKERIHLDNRKYELLSELMTIHEKLCDLCSLLNKAFDVPLLITISNQFATSMFCIFNVYLRFNVSFESALCWLGYSVLRIAGIFVKTSMCDFTIRQLNNTNGVINKIMLLQWSSKIQRKFHIFSLHLMLRKVTFSACGLFKINSNLFYSVLFSLTTYAIIIIQFQTSSATINCGFNITVNGSIVT